MRQFDADQDRERCSKRFETEHWPRDAFDRAVSLLDNVVEILACRSTIGTLRSLFSCSSAGWLAPPYPSLPCQP
jgi:hypothetical protein